MIGRLVFFILMGFLSGSDHFIDVPAHVSWTDTGIDVTEGQEISFRASGSVSLQRGNPIAVCGPEGYNLKTMQQPLKDHNIGALIGRIVFLISVEIDEETKEEIRNEIIETFYIGSRSTVVMPIKGRLFLGINESLVGDNVGRFEVNFDISNRDDY